MLILTCLTYPLSSSIFAKIRYSICNNLIQISQEKNSDEPRRRDLEDFKDFSNPFDFFESLERVEFFRSIGLPGRGGEIIPWEIRNPTGEIIQVGYAWLHNGSFSSVKTAETRWNRRSRSTGADGPGIHRGILSAGQGVFLRCPRGFSFVLARLPWLKNPLTRNLKLTCCPRSVRYALGRRGFTRPKNCRV